MRLIQIIFFTSCAIFATNHCIAQPLAIPPIAIYVSTLGNDQADGRSPAPGKEGSHGPFATLDRARDELRILRNKGVLLNGATVYVLKGTYELPDTFELETKDSGTPKAPIVYRTYKNEKVILFGGRRLSNCDTNTLGQISCSTINLKLNTLDPMGLDKRMSSAPLPAFEVFVNEKRLQLTRWPNSNRDAPGGDTWAYVTSAKKDARTQFEYRGKSTGISHLSDNAVIDIWPGNDWFDEYIGISNITPTTVSLARPTVYPIQAGRRFSILNDPETMDAPGEWYYSPDKQVISIVPIPDLKDHVPVISYLNSIIEIHNAQNIQLKGFTIEESRKTAVVITGGSSNTLENCIVHNTGGYGIEIQGGRHHKVINSEIYDTGYGGVILQGGNRKTLAASAHIVMGNNIHDTGRLIRTGKAALILGGVGNTASHNHIHHIPGTAVQISGNDHILEFNDIYNACEESHDCGAVYSGRDWTFYGNIIRYNRIHDIYGYGMKSIDTKIGIVEYEKPNRASGVYLDDEVSGINIIGNVLYRIPGMMIQIGGGRNNTIDNNIFVTSGYAIWINTRGPDIPWQKSMFQRLNAVPYKGAAWRSRFPRLAEETMKHPYWPEGTQITHNIIYNGESTGSAITPFRYAIPSTSVEINNNIVWNQGKSAKVEYHFLGGKKKGIIDWGNWKKTGLDKDSKLTNPNFVDADQGNLTLQPNSPARSLGIQDIPLNEIATDRTDSRNVTETMSPAEIFKFKLE